MSEENVVVDVATPNPSEVEARKFGWVPQEEFHGDPNQWRDADTFLRKGREINGFLRKDLEKLNTRNATLEAELTELRETMTEFSKFHQETAKREYDRALRDLRELKKEAIAEGDGDRVVQIEDAIDQLKQEKPPEVKAPKEPPKVDPVFIQWREQNQWYGTDEDMTVFADGFAERLRKQKPELVGLDFLAEVEKKVQSTFKKEVRPSACPSPVDVSTPSRGSTSKKSYADLPAEAKQACDKFVKQGLLSKDQYVKDYFGE